MMIESGPWPPDWNRDLPFVREFYKGKFWTAPNDFVTTSETIIPPGTSWVHTTLDHTCLPPLQKLTPSIVAFSEIGVRSRMAQCGLDVDPDSTVENLVNGLTPDTVDLLKTGTTVGLEVLMTNKSGRPRRIPGGVGLFALYCPWVARVARNDELVRMVEQEQRIIITGEKEKDWEYITMPAGKVALNLAINPDSWTYYPAEEASPEPVDVPIETTYRDQIDAGLTRYSAQRPPKGRVLWVCQSTATICIADEEINGIIPDFLFVRSLGPREAFGVRHLHALLIRGGAAKTNWPLRFEIECDVDNRPTHVRLDILKNRSSSDAREKPQ